MVTGTKVIVVESPGGLYPEGFQEPYLRQLLGFIGLTDVRFVHAERIGFGADARAASIAAAVSRLREVLPGERQAA